VAYASKVTLSSFALNPLIKGIAKGLTEREAFLVEKILTQIESASDFSKTTSYFYASIKVK
jgi:hypothetical protein